MNREELCDFLEESRVLNPGANVLVLPPDTFESIHQWATPVDVEDRGGDEYFVTKRLLEDEHSLTIRVISTCVEPYMYNSSTDVLCTVTQVVLVQRNVLCDLCSLRCRYGSGVAEWEALCYLTGSPRKLSHVDSDSHKVYFRVPECMEGGLNG